MAPSPQPPASATPAGTPPSDELVNDIHAFADAARVFATHLADVKLGPLAVALLLHTINLLLRTCAWYSILRAAYPGVRYRYRSCAGAYLAGVGVNAIAPARGGDLVKIFLTRTRLEGSTTPTILASLLVETLIDAVLGIGILGFALTQHVLPRVPELPSMPASSGRGRPRTRRSRRSSRRSSCSRASSPRGASTSPARPSPPACARASRSCAPRAATRSVALPQLVGWACRVGAAAAFLEAFGIPGTLRNALLVMVVGSLTTLLPVTPGGVGTQQALIVVVLSGAASDSQLLSFSVGAQAAVMVSNALLGGIALVLMLRTLSLRSAIGHARHTQRADSAPYSSRRARRARRGRPSRRRWPDGARSRGRAGRARRARAPRCGRRRSSRAAPGARSARPAPRRPRATRRRAGVRFESGSPGRCGCAGTTFQSTVSASIPSVASAPWTIVPDCSAQPSGRRLVAAKGAPQPSSVRSAVNAMPEKRPPA